MGKDIFILVKCSEPTQLSQKFQACTAAQEEIKRVRGIKKTFYTGKPMTADITAFAKWKDNEIDLHTQEIKNISGVKTVEIKSLIPV